MSARRPPRAALKLLEALLPEEEREAVIGDLVEAHEAFARERPMLASLRFYREALTAIVELQFTPESVSAFTPYAQETPVQSFVGDVRHAIRLLSRARGFTALCVLTLGIAIGATAAIFSVVNPVILRPLPYPNPDRLITVWEHEADGPSNLGYLTYLDLRKQASTLEHAAAVGDWQPTIFGESDAELVSGQRVSWEFFRTLGVHPALGRDFEQDDDTPSNNNVVILSDGLWTRRFARDPGIIGKALNIGGLTRTVIGVMPPGFTDVLKADAEIWRVLGYSETLPYACRTCRHLRVIGRLAQGTSTALATRDLDRIMSRVIAADPKEYSSTGITTIGLQEQITQRSRPILLAILGAVVLVLLIAAANVVNLQLARAVRRREEFAVRAALGAGRGRLARQLLAEGLLLAVVSGAAGILLAYLLVPALVSRLPDMLPRVSEIRVDWAVLGLVGLLTLAVGVLVGLIPAWSAGRARLYDALRGAARALGASHHRARAVLVVTQVALALMLVIGATLLGRSLTRLLAVNVGFDAGHLVTMDVQAAGTAYQAPGSVLANHDRMLDAVGAVPGVTSVGLATQIPLGGNVDLYGIEARDKPLANPELAPYAARYTVAGDFIRTMRIPLLRGRDFSATELRDTSTQVAIVSEALAKAVWPGDDAIGKYIRLGGSQRPWKQVVGVVGNVRHTGLDETVSRGVYIPERQWYNEENSMVLVARVTGNPSGMMASVRDAVRGVDRLQPINHLRSMEDLIARSTSQRRLGLLLFMAFGSIALMLAAGGVYGILAGSVSERTREFGLRAALGATPSSIARLVVRDAARLAGLGLVLGGVGAFLLVRYLKALLFDVSASDPVALAASVSVIIAVAVLACLIPARRAVSVDAMTALRSD